MSEDSNSSIKLKVEDFGVCLNEKGKRVTIKRFTWTNDKHLQIQLTNYGATITSIKYPDKYGLVDDVIWGFENLSAYKRHKKHYIGSTIGRYANIIANGRFKLARREYQLRPNLGEHHYNGGSRGFHQMVWHYEVDKNAVILTHFSPHNHDGYPGHLIVKATFELLESNEFRIEYRVVTTKLTIINITNNCFFNLAGHFMGPHEMKRHRLALNCDKFTVTDEDNVPTGQVKSVEHSEFDFRKLAYLDNVLDKYGGIDRNYCVVNAHRSKLMMVAQLSHPVSGRIVEVYSNRPGLQVNTANEFPERPEGEDAHLARAKCKALNTGVITFDILDEIYNEIKRIAKVTDGDFGNLLELVRELEYKSRYVYRILCCNKAGVPFYKYIKRAALTLEGLADISLTPLQKKFVQRIVHEIKCTENNDALQRLHHVLEKLLLNNCESTEDVQRAAASLEDIDKMEEIVLGKEKSRYWRHGAISLQPQNFPDAINHSKFPDCELTPGKDYVHIIKYKFRVESSETGLAGIL